MSTDRITRLLGRRAEGVERAVCVAAFGKHPGWNDHIDDQGIETQTLADVKQLLYVQGIGGTIDAGAWEELDEDARLEVFDHAFVWLRGGTVVVGRFWSSTDGKGRAKYPMIVCAQCDGVSLDWAVSVAMDRLEALGERCRGVQTAEEVIALVDAARADLRAAMVDAPQPHDDPESATATATIAACDAMPEDGYERVLYQIHREMGSYLPMGSGSTVRTGEARPQHIRLPRCAMPVGAALGVWARFFAEHLGSGTPVLLAAPVEASWIDAIVGEPGQAQFLCLRANDKTIPLACDVPYTLDDEFRERARADADRSLAEVLESMAGGSGAGAAAEAIKQRVADRIAQIGEHKGWRPTKLMIGLAAASVVLVILLLVLAMGGGSKPVPKGDDAAAAQPTGKTTRQAAVPTALSAADRARWVAWCEGYSGWYRGFARTLDRAVLDQDTRLAERIGPVLGASDRAMDPRRVVRRGSRSFEVLIKTPPAEAGTAEAVARATEAVAAMDAVRGALGADQWPARAQMRRIVERLEGLGLGEIARRVGQLDEAMGFDDGKALARAVEAVIRAEPALDRLDTLLERIERDNAQLAGVDDAIVARRAEAVADAVGALGPGATLDLVADALVPVAGVFDRLAAFAGSGWGLIDEEQFRTLSGIHRDPPQRVTAAALDRWLFQASQDKFVALDPQADPRRGFDPEPIGAALGARLDGLGEAATIAGVDTSALEGRLDAVGAQMREVWSLRWSKASEQRIVSGVGAIRRELDALGREIESTALTLSQDASSYRQGLAAKGRISPSESTAIDGAWVAHRDELLAAMPGVDAYAALRARADELEAFLTGLESGLTGPDIEVPAGLGIDRAALAEAQAARRERAIEAVLTRARWTGEHYERDAGLDAALGAQQKALDAWGASAGRALALMKQAETLVDRCKPLDEAGASGETILGLMAQARSEPAAQAVAPAAAGLITRIDRIGQLGTQQDAGVLIETAMTSGDLASSVAAWRRLGELDGWPATVADLDQERAIEDRIRANLGEIDAADDRGAREAELAAQASARWARAVEGASSRSAFEALLAQGERFGGRVEELTAPSRFNAAVMDLASALDPARSGQLDEEAVRAELTRTVARIDAIGAPLGEAEGAWVEDLRTLATEDRADVPVLDFSTIGPGTKGWVAQPNADGTRVEYTLPGSGLRLTFVRVDPDLDAGLDGTAFVADREVSVAFASEVIKRFSSLESLAPGWGDVRAVLAGRAAWGGPRSWAVDVEGGGLVPNPRWLSTTIRGGVVPLYAPGLVVDEPSGSDPLDRISARGAMELAALVGCRLPTAVEWRAALGQHESVGAVWNLRDATWARQRDHAAGHQEAGRRVPWPDEGAFLPRSMDLPREGAARVVAGDDGVLWFEDVDAARGRVLHHLIGNVAELVLDDGSGDQFGVIGGSALSAPGLGVDRMVALESRQSEQGFADVGMRLGFGIEGLDFRVPIRFQVSRLLRAAPFLSPGG